LPRHHRHRAGKAPTKPPAVRLARSSLTIIAALCLAATGQAAQQQSDPASRTEAIQIGEAEGRTAPGKAYLDNDRKAQPSVPPNLMQADGDQISRAPASSAPTSQITNRNQSGQQMPQLSRADLDATLAQLSATERRVLLQAIEGTDICDNPPAVPAVVALCQTRLETRSQEFAGRAEPQLSAEERLLGDNFDNAGLPSVGQVIERLARTSAATNDFSNQAIASIALGQQGAAPPGRGEEQADETLGLSSETQALINAIVNQLGGGAGGSP